MLKTKRIGTPLSVVPSQHKVLTTFDVWDEEHNPNGVIVPKDELEKVVRQAQEDATTSMVFDTLAEAKIYPGTHPGEFRVGDMVFIRNPNTEAGEVTQYWWDGEELQKGQTVIDLTIDNVTGLRSELDELAAKPAGIKAGAGITATTISSGADQGKVEVKINDATMQRISDLENLVGQANTTLEQAL